jgi:hypothetical protein
MQPRRAGPKATLPRTGLFRDLSAHLIIPLIENLGCWILFDTFKSFQKVPTAQIQQCTRNRRCDEAGYNIAKVKQEKGNVAVT